MLAGVEEAGRRRPKGRQPGNSPDFDSSLCLKLERRIAAVHWDRASVKAGIEGRKLLGLELNSIV
jgi:hypothetical protein